MPCSLLRRIVHLVSNLLFLHAPVTYPNQPGAGPQIIVLSPQEGDTVTAPFDLDVRFLASPDAHIAADTLKVEVKKMLWGVDVTAHIKQFTDAGGIRMTRTFQKDTIRSRFRLRMSGMYDL